MARMDKNKGIALYWFFIIANFANAEIFFSLIQEKDPCETHCEETPLLEPDVILADLAKKYLMSSCQRGCRFFNLVDLCHGIDPVCVNNTLKACNASCTEAYLESQDCSACNVGCTYKAIQRISDMFSLVSFIASQNAESMFDKALAMSPETVDNDVLADPGLRKELLPAWWDRSFKLPEAYFKTIPMDSEVVDYAVSVDYNVENEKPTSIPGSDWLECASRHTGVPTWLLGSCIIIAILSAIWLCLSPEKSNESFDKLTIANASAPHKVTVYLPDEAPIHKTPPPKYSEIADSLSEDIKS